MVMKKTIIGLILIIFCFFSISPVLQDGFFPMHDDAQVARVVVMGKALLSGEFPVRIVRDLGYGYGYPIFNFYGPLPYYVGGMFSAIGVPGLTATKIMMICGMVLGTLAAYILGRRLFGVAGGMTSALFFTFFPYRAVQLYVRGAVGELWATSCFLIILVGLLCLGDEKRRVRGIFIGALGLAGTILSHTVLGYAGVGILSVGLVCFLLYAMCVKRQIPQTFFSFCMVIVFGLAISAFFWLPAFFEMRYTNVSSVIGSTADFHNHFVCLSQLWDSPWGFGGSAPGCIDGMSFKLGKIHILIFTLSLLLWIFSFKKKSKEMQALMALVFIGCFASVFFTIGLSQYLWEHIPYFSFIQYPWRFLSFAGIFLSITAGFVVYRMPNAWHSWIIFIFIALVGLFYIPLFQPQYTYWRNVSDFEQKEDIRYRASLVSDEYLPPDIPKPQNENEAMAGRISQNDTVSVKTLWENETGGEYEIDAKKTYDLRIRLAYFPGWTFSVNGKKVTPAIERGMPIIVLSEGASKVRMEFQNTFIRILANWISFAGCIMLLYVYGKETFGYYRRARI